MIRISKNNRQTKYFEDATSVFPLQLIRWISVLVLFVSLFSCEKVIDINLNEATAKYVVEGNVSNLISQYPEVKISQTKKFAADNSFRGIGGANVTIQVNGGTIYQLREKAAGIYQTDAFAGIPGNTYALSVTVGDNNYTSTSVMPLQLVTLDTLTVENLDFAGINNLTIFPDYLDPAGPGNSYRLIEYINGVQVKKVFAQNDEISDGLRITRPLIFQDSNDDNDLQSGDTVMVELQCIDENMYKYWYSLDEAATGENQSATPANPVTNIAGGALGYFSAYSVSDKIIVVP